MSNEFFKYLGRLIPDKDTARRIVELSDIPIDRIDFNASPKNMWYRIFTEANRYKKGNLRVIQSALDEFPEDEFLKNELNKLTTDSEVKETEVSNITPTSPSIDKAALKNMIALNKIEIVLENLNRLKDHLSSSKHNEFILLVSKFNSYKSESTMGVTSPSELDIRKNKLMLSLMEFIDSI